MALKKNNRFTFVPCLVSYYNYDCVCINVKNLTSAVTQNSLRLSYTREKGVEKHTWTSIVIHNCFPV